MSHIKGRLSYYHGFMKKLVDDHQMVLASDVLEMIEQLQDDLELDEKEKCWFQSVRDYRKQVVRIK